MPVIQFDHIGYLASGTLRQQQAYQLLTQHRLMNILHEFDPILAGTIPINIDIENSDLDIICCFNNKEGFKNALTLSFSDFDDFLLTDTLINQQETIVVDFSVNGWSVEIFGQQTPTRQQNAYRHMMVEYILLEHYGEAFRQDVIKLKKQGYKTEPAFAKLLDLPGDPYMELLKPDLISRLSGK